MAYKRYRPKTPGLRKKVTLTYDEVTTNTPEKSLVQKIQKSSGRNNYGNITVRHQGGGVKRRYRVVDFQRKTNSIGKVASIEYDPNRSALISLIK